MILTIKRRRRLRLAVATLRWLAPEIVLGAAILAAGWVLR
jgi:hypothetical protein